MATQLHSAKNRCFGTFPTCWRQEVFTSFLQADQVLCRELSRLATYAQTSGATIEMTGYGASGTRATACSEHIKNILAHNSTRKYVAGLAWELEAKLNAHNFCAEFPPSDLWPYKWSWASFRSVLPSPHGTVPQWAMVMTWLWLKDLCTVSCLHSVAIPSDFTTTAMICVAEITGFPSVNSWIESNNSAVLGEHVQETKKPSQSGGKALPHGNRDHFSPRQASLGLSHTINR